jgi:hypothetical protein
MTQKQKIIHELNYKGYVSRNEALRNYITRLAALICDLKKEGYEFIVEEKGGDYIYKIDRKRDMVELDLATNNYKLKYV